MVPCHYPLCFIYWRMAFFQIYKQRIYLFVFSGLLVVVFIRLFFMKSRGFAPAPAVVANIRPKTYPQLDLTNFRSDVEIAAIPEETILKTFSDQTLRHLYLHYLENADILCHSKLRMGNLGDGGWEVCDDIRWRPRRDCLIYSFGINYDFSFDDHVTSTYQCHLYAFDPSMQQNTYNRSALVHFYKWGLYDFDGLTPENWRVFTLSSIKKSLGHEKRMIDIVKMDIEEAEWRALPKMGVDGDLDKICQLYVEFHDSPMNTSKIIFSLNVFRSLQQAGFRKFYCHKNPFCSDIFKEYPGTTSRCMEVHMVNINCKNK